MAPHPRLRTDDGAVPRHQAGSRRRAQRRNQIARASVTLLPTLAHGGSCHRDTGSLLASADKCRDGDEWRERIPSMSLTSKETSDAQHPKPPFSLTARTHSRRNSYLVRL